METDFTSEENWNNGYGRADGAGSFEPSFMSTGKGFSEANGSLYGVGLGQGLGNGRGLSFGEGYGDGIACRIAEALGLHPSGCQ